jgi:predicted protein tyrosine phosphatase
VSAYSGASSDHCFAGLGRGSTAAFASARAFWTREDDTVYSQREDTLVNRSILTAPHI